MARFLDAAVKGKLNIIVCGGTGSGKTTLLNILSGFINDNERIITIEDAAELRLEQNHVISLETRTMNYESGGEVTIRDLVINSLRMRPDRIIVGEVRGKEAFDMLQAMNTGHDGSLTTIHANGPMDALNRLETLVLMSGLDIPIKAVREYIDNAIDLVVNIDRMNDGKRKITSICEVDGFNDDDALIEKVPKVFNKIKARGINLVDDMFEPFKKTKTVKKVNSEFITGAMPTLKTKE